MNVNAKVSDFFFGKKIDIFFSPLPPPVRRWPTPTPMVTPTSAPNITHWIARYFLTQYTKTGKNIPNYYQITKRP
jgi:hypothetical protein